MRQCFRHPSKNKYGAEKVVEDGITFDSKVEHQRYLYLKDKVKKGEICNLQTHKTYELLPKQTIKVVKHLKTKDKIEERTLFHSIAFTPDFVYEQDGKVIAEDVKGSKMLISADFPLRRKLLYYKYGIYVNIVVYTKSRGWEVS